MNRVKTIQTWIDGHGRTHEVRKMADDHIMNCIALLRRRINNLNEVEWECKKISDEIDNCKASIDMFVDELLWREANDVTVERGCYD